MGQIFLWMILILIVIFILPSIWLVKVQNRKRKYYNACLAELRKDPNNTALRVRALNAGRIYYREATAGKKNLKFDIETAIQNDITSISGQR